VFPDLFQSQLRIVVEQVENAQLIGGDHELIELVVVGDLAVDYGIAHGEVPLELSVMVVLLILVESLEIIHACLYLLRHGQLKGLV